MNPFAPLQELVERGMQPTNRMLWISLGVLPPKHNGIVIDLNRLPTDRECLAVAGLDVVLVIRGFPIKYGTLRRLCGSLYQARPRLLMLSDVDFNYNVYLKVFQRR